MNKLRRAHIETLKANALQMIEAGATYEELAENMKIAVSEACYKKVGSKKHGAKYAKSNEVTFSKWFNIGECIK